MVEVIELCKVELFKVRKRALPWVLLVAAGGVFTFFLWMLFYPIVRTRDLPILKEVLSKDFGVFYGHEGEVLPYVLYWPSNFLHIIVDFMAIVFAASTFNQDYNAGMLRTLIGHGLCRSRYLAAQGAALLASLIFAWSAIALATLFFAFVHTYFIKGELVWQSSYWIDILRMIAGNSLRYFSAGCFVLLTVVLFRRPLLGVIGGVFYFQILEPIVPWSLEELDLLQFIPYTPLHAGNALLDPSIAMTGPELVRAMLVLLLWGVLSLALAAVIFNKRDLA